uniref:Uncharacterized protein n=1 Tax=Anguilla anguilla TaxID=7936 RepID=A0A0E9XV22_ANGAN
MYLFIYYVFHIIFCSIVNLNFIYIYELLCISLQYIPESVCTADFIQ